MLTLRNVLAESSPYSIHLNKFPYAKGLNHSFNAKLFMSNDALGPFYVVTSI